MPADVGFRGYNWIDSDMRDTFTIWSGLVEVKDGTIGNVFIPLKQNEWKVHGNSSQVNQSATPSSTDGVEPTAVPNIKPPSATEEANKDEDRSKAYQWNVEN